MQKKTARDSADEVSWKAVFSRYLYPMFISRD
jgi:hypothetical protein